MEDRYLWRAKNEKGEWKYWNIFAGVYGEGINQKSHTLGQCTGLKDKNGKLIFEGDIRKRYGHAGVVKYGKIKIEVNNEYSCDYLGFYLDLNNGFTPEIEYCDLENSEIIGNIHDNPELLEKL